MDDQQRARELEAVAERNLSSYVIRHVPAGPDRVSALLCIDTLAALRAAPEGFVMVPVEPTDEMCAAAMVRIKEVTVVIDAGPAKGSTLVRDPYYHAYKAMLAARPQGVKDV